MDVVRSHVDDLAARIGRLQEVVQEPDEPALAPADDLAPEEPLSQQIGAAGPRD
jgi:hypothetical protein